MIWSNVVAGSALSAIAAAAVTGDQTPGYAHALIQALTGVDAVTDAALVAWARAAERALQSLEEHEAANVPDLLTEATQLVVDWNAPRPEQSAVLAAGFEARLAVLARELDGILCPPVTVVAFGYPPEIARRAPVGFGVLIRRHEGLRMLGVLWDSQVIHHIRVFGGVGGGRNG